MDDNTDKSDQVCNGSEEQLPEYNVAEILRLLMEKANLGENELARQTSVKQPTIHRILMGDSKEPRDSTLRPLARRFGITIAQLRGDEPVAGIHSNVNIVPRSRENIPLIGWRDIRSWSMQEQVDVLEWLPAPARISGRSVALKMLDNSMVSPYPGQRSYPEGTVVIFDDEGKLEHGKKVIAIVGEDGDAVFRIYIKDAGKAFLLPINPQYEKIEVTKNVKICGIAVGTWLPE